MFLSNLTSQNQAPTHNLAWNYYMYYAYIPYHERTNTQQKEMLGLYKRQLELNREVACRHQTRLSYPAEVTARERLNHPQATKHRLRVAAREQEMRGEEGVYGW